MHLPPLAWQAGDGEDIRLDKDRHATPRRLPSSLPSFQSQSHRGLVMKLGGRALQMMWSGAGRGEDPRGDEEEEEEEIGSPSLI